MKRETRNLKLALLLCALCALCGEAFAGGAPPLPHFRIVATGHGDFAVEAPEPQSPSSATQVLVAAFNAAAALSVTPAINVENGSFGGSAVTPTSADQVLVGVWDNTNKALKVNCVSGCGASFPNQSANVFFSGPSSGGSAAPAFRAIVAADIPTLNQNTTGTAAGLAGSQTANFFYSGPSTGLAATATFRAITEPDIVTAVATAPVIANPLGPTATGATYVIDGVTYANMNAFLAGYTGGQVANVIEANCANETGANAWSTNPWAVISWLHLTIKASKTACQSNVQVVVSGGGLEPEGQEGNLTGSNTGGVALDAGSGFPTRIANPFLTPTFAAGGVVSAYVEYIYRTAAGTHSEVSPEFHCTSTTCVISAFPAPLAGASNVALYDIYAGTTSGSEKWIATIKPSQLPYTIPNLASYAFGTYPPHTNNTGDLVVILGPNTCSTLVGCTPSDPSQKNAVFGVKVGSSTSTLYLDAASGSPAVAYAAGCLSNDDGEELSGSYHVVCRDAATYGVAYEGNDGQLAAINSSMVGVQGAQAQGSLATCGGQTPGTGNTPCEPGGYGPYWTASTVYAVNNYIVDNSNPPHYQLVTSCTGSCTSAASEPTFNTSGSTVNDGTGCPGSCGANYVTWTDQGAVPPLQNHWSGAGTWHWAHIVDDQAPIRQIGGDPGSSSTPDSAGGNYVYSSVSESCADANGVGQGRNTPISNIHGEKAANQTGQTGPAVTNKDTVDVVGCSGIVVTNIQGQQATAVAFDANTYGTVIDAQAVSSGVCPLTDAMEGITCSSTPTAFSTFTTLGFYASGPTVGQYFSPQLPGTLAGIGLGLDPTAIRLADEFNQGSTSSGGIGALQWTLAQIVGTTTAVSYAGGTAPNIGVLTMTAQAVSGDGGDITFSTGGRSAFGNMTTPWDSFWIFELPQSTNVAMRIGYFSSTTAVVPGAGFYLRFDTNLSDTNFEVCNNPSGTEGCSSYGTAPSTSTFYRLRVRNITSGAPTTPAIGLSLYSGGSLVGSELTICANAGCTINAAPPTGAVSPGAEVVAYTGSGQTLKLDAFYFSATGLTR
jgi:hypothetical protein